MMNRTQTHRFHFTAILFYTLVLLSAAGVAAADTLTLAWDPSPDPDVTGYYVYVGTVPGKYSQRFDVGRVTSFVFNQAVAGTPYYFTASSYNADRLEGYPTVAVNGYSNAPPTLTNPGAQSTLLGSAVSLRLLGSDLYGQALTYRSAGLPIGLSLSQTTGLISGAPSSAGTYSVTATVSDGLLSAVTTFSWIVGTDAPPNLTQPATQSTTTGNAVTLQLVASSPLGRPITYGSTVLPAGLTLSASTGRISGTPTTAGTTAVTVTASDGTLSTSKTFTWIVTSSTTSSSTANKPPALTFPGNQKSSVGVSVSLKLSGSDPEGKPVTYKVSALPAGLVLNATTGVISGVPSAVTTMAVTATASDGVLSSGPVAFTWTVASR